MGRIPEHEIERLKKEISVERLVEARGVALKRHGKDLVGLCPFHDDREPSLVVTPEKNLWHCLGACQTGGSVIDWVMRSEGVAFRYAVEILRAQLDGEGIQSARPLTAGAPPKKSTVQKLPVLLERDAEDEQLLANVVDYYHATLKESPEAMDYLAGRGLRSSEMMEHFKLGFANRTLGYRLPAKTRAEGEALRTRLQKLGLIRESGHEHFNGCVVVPIYDEDGRVRGLYGRKIAPKVPAGTPVHLYLAGGHRAVWNVAALRASEDVVLCESIIDALTFWCAGYRNVITSYGVEGFADAHRDALRKYETKTVRIAYDRDDAGDKAAAKLSEELNALGIETYRVLFPKGMDANEYGSKVQPAEKSLGLVLRKAEWTGKGTRAPISPARDEDVDVDHVAAPDAHANVVLHDEDGVVLEDAPAPAPSLAASSSVGTSSPPTTPGAIATDAPERDELVFRMGDRRWRVRGLGKNLSFGQMRVNVAVWREGGGFFVDTLDLYTAKVRASFTRSASSELGTDESVIKRELGELLLRLEEKQEAHITEALSPKKAEPVMSEESRREALAFLRSPRLIERITEDFAACGVVGEDTNKLVGYLAAVSRKLEQPLAVVIQSSSAAGKSSLMDAVLAMVPEEERVSYSAMTGQSLFYMGQEDLRHKVLAVAEEAGAERASYALKLLQSEGELTIASTGKDPVSGKLVTHTYRVAGPVQLFLTTTAITVDEELLNRCIVLTVDEGMAQTKAIHDEQRASQTLEGIFARAERTRVRALHQNAQRLLQPLVVVNPFAKELSFSDHRTRTRRDHMKYLTLIRAVALLHQHQRDVKTAEHRGELVRYIEATRDDIAVADRLAAAVLSRSEELPPQTERLLSMVEAYVADRAKAEHVETSEVRFTRREVREHTGFGHTQLKVHMQRLEELEYLHALRAGRGSAPSVYMLAYDSAWSGSQARWSGQNGPWSGGGRPLVGPRSAGGRGPTARTNEDKTSPLMHAGGTEAPNAVQSSVRVAAS